MNITSGSKTGGKGPSIRLFNFAPAAFLGLQNSVTPGSLTIFLFFLVFMKFAVSSRRLLSTFGFIFIVVIVFLNLMGVFGTFDGLAINLRAAAIMRVFYIVTGLFFVSVGFINFQDWLLLRKDRSKNVDFFRIPQPFEGILRKIHGVVLFFDRGNFIFVGIAQLLMSVFVALLSLFLFLMGSVWSKDYHTFVMFQDMTAAGRLEQAVPAIVVFAFFSAFLFFAAWALCLLVTRYDGLKSFFVQRLRLAKMVVSAVYLAVGLILVIFYTPMN